MCAPRQPLCSWLADGLLNKLTLYFWSLSTVRRFLSVITTGYEKSLLNLRRWLSHPLPIFPRVSSHFLLNPCSVLIVLGPWSALGS